MPIVNRDLDSSQQTSVMSVSLSGTVTSATYILATFPSPAQLIAVHQSALGLSGAPNHSLWLNRFVVGAGVTSVAIGMSMATSAYGTSGAQGFTVISGSSNLIQADDVLVLSTAAANTAAASLNITLAVKALQDIKTSFGV